MSPVALGTAHRGPSLKQQVLLPLKIVISEDHKGGPPTVLTVCTCHQIPNLESPGFGLIFHFQPLSPKPSLALMSRGPENPYMTYISQYALSLA